MCVAPAVGVSWYWPPGRTYKSPEKALGFSHVYLRKHLFSKPFNRVGNRELRPFAKGKEGSGRARVWRESEKGRQSHLEKARPKTRSEEIILHSCRVYINIKA